MNISIRHALLGQENDLAEIRARAMRKSLESVNRYDYFRVRRRLLDNYKIENTRVIYLDNKIIGFYCTTENDNYKYIDHLYIEPNECGKGYGKIVLKEIIEGTTQPIRLNALKESMANDFYLKNGFYKIGESEFDNMYEFKKKQQPNKRST